MAEEKQKGPTPEELNVQKDIFKNEFLRNLALSKESQITEQYGSFGKSVLEGTYQSTVASAPDQLAYEVSGLAASLSKRESITAQQVQQNAEKYWTSSIAYQSGADIGKEMGVDLGEKYSGLIAELDDESAGKIIGSYFQYRTTDLMEKEIKSQKESIGKGLVKILNEKPKEKTQPKQ